MCDYERGCDETQEHLMECKVLGDDNMVVEEVPEYVHLFGENLQKKIVVAKILHKNFNKRKPFKQRTSRNLIGLTTPWGGSKRSCPHLFMYS